MTNDDILFIADLALNGFGYMVKNIQQYSHVYFEIIKIEWKI